MNNIQSAFLPKYETDNNYETNFFIFDNIKYKIRDILKLIKFIPTKKYSISALNSILLQIEIPKIDNIYNLANYVKHLLNNAPNYLIILQIDELTYKYVYGYEYVIKELNIGSKTLAVKIITTDLLQKIYISNKKITKS